MSAAEVAQVQPVAQTAYYQLPPGLLGGSVGWQAG